MKETVDAGKTKYGADEAIALAKKSAKVIAMKGKNVVVLDIKKDAPDDETLKSYLLGPTGNLRAPTFIVGKTMYVGFNEETYTEHFGG